MANRVLLGTRGSDKGLFVSRSGQNVLTSNEPLGFDSRSAETLQVHSYGQGILVPQVQHISTGAQLTYTFNSVTYSTVETTISYPTFGYVPAFAVRFTHGNNLQNGFAHSSFSCFRYKTGNEEYTEEDQEEEGDEVTVVETSASSGLQIKDVTTSSFKLRNVAERTHDDQVGKASSLNPNSVYFYSYVIFINENFTNNQSL